MESFSELVRLRRSMRKFTEEELTQDEAVCLLRAALMSPSSKGRRPWEFVVVDDKESLRALAHCKERGAELIEGAPLAVAVLADPALSDAWVEDASVAAAMMLLQAEDLGLGACWVQVRGRTTADGKPAEEMVRAALRVPGHLRVLSIVAVGHKGMERKPFDESRLQWEKVHINAFGATGECGEGREPARGTGHAGPRPAPDK